MGCVRVPCQKTFSKPRCLCVAWSMKVSCPGWKAGQGPLQRLSLLQESRIVFLNKPVSPQGTRSLLGCPCTTSSEVVLTQCSQKFPGHILQKTNSPATASPGPRSSYMFQVPVSSRLMSPLKYQHPDNSHSVLLRFSSHWNVVFQQAAFAPAMLKL